MVGSGDLCLGHIEVYQRAIELTEHKLILLSQHRISWRLPGETLASGKLMFSDMHKAANFYCVPLQITVSINLQI
ncbi:hypothetical protein CK203_036929 [Vitis vinifera]|uniref:Uncharacterized protein n=1 Tax=Vitis vinifera TaxID=29760 RepID=A0A438IUS8_VITVI|nr:hypothetical protein CK203_036929 [Vitis vinifera]